MDQEKKTFEERYKYIESQKALNSWVKKNLSWIILVIASILFIFKEGLEFSANKDNVITLIMSMLFTYLFAMYVSITLRQMGKKSGKESSIYNTAIKYLADAKQDIKNFIYLLPRFVKYKNETSLKDVQKLYIEENGLDWYLYEKNFYKEKTVYDDLEDIQKKALEYIKKIKITKLTVNSILSEHSKNKLKHVDPLYLGKDENTDHKSSMISMLVTKSVLPIITSYFAIQVVLGTSLLWGAIQVAVILLMGVTHFMEGEDYVVTELRNRQINKADLLIEFKNLYDTNSGIFKEELDLIKKIEKQSEEEIQKPLEKDILKSPDIDVEIEKILE
jgi:hypothetical protein